MFDELKEIYDIYSVSSCEKKLNTYLKEKYEKYSDEIVEDRLYSIFAKRLAENPENRRKIMIACAMDEIGLIVSAVDKDNHANFLNLEDLSPASLLHQRVNITTRDNENISGFITINKKILEEKISTIKLEDLYVETFDDTKLNIGDLIALESELIETENNIIGRSLTQKIPQYLSIKILEKIKERKLNNNFYIGAIAQSTIGFRGTKTANHVVEPDLAIVVTGFEVNNSNPKIELGDGVIVGYYDSKMIPDQNLLRYITERYETKPYVGVLGNDGSFIHKTLAGVPTLSVGIPMKNMGTSSVIVSKNDIEKLETFLLKLIEDENISNLIRRER
ncbi:zinc-binding metallopeptidase family protein [Helcococcus kunzii]|uniref:hypothetical protein n=1 Tax=Helcococcus kunzii TaxID=40091 RepID=UPI0038A281D3